MADGAGGRICLPNQHIPLLPAATQHTHTYRAAGIYDSLTKLRRVLDLCERLGVHTQPRQLGSLWIVPLFRWGSLGGHGTRVLILFHCTLSKACAAPLCLRTDPPTACLPACLCSWHHQSWDTEPDIPGVPPVSAWTIADYAACKWPHSVPGGC